MALLSQFSTPADVQDFPTNPLMQTTMNQLWSGNVNRWVEAALIGDVWDLVNYGPRPAFYNPLNTDTPTGAVNAAITWNAFPGRIQALFPNNPAQWMQWADQGVPDQVTTDLCSKKTIPEIPYPPTGPRGWQDEYCEWCVTRDANNNITSVMFTCENPEYWMTLWQTDPKKVFELYQGLVGSSVVFDDLCLCDAAGNIIYDPISLRPYYNPLNIWNSGTQTLGNKGGAVHLTSSPNTLGAEFDLAAAASMPRSVNGQPVTNASDLVCCARYGKIGRHSDPTIGQNVNQYVNYTAGLTQVRATLTNPVGLYIQTPDFSNYQTPDGSPASECWHVIRGHSKDPRVLGDIDRLLHVKFSVPAGKSFTVSDISISGAKIQYASQIAQTFNMALMATVYGNSGVTQTSVACTATNPDPSPSVSAIQPLNVFMAYRNLEAQSNELSLSVPILAQPIAQGQTLQNIALLLNTSDTPAGAVFTVPEGDVSIAVTGTQTLPGADLSVYLVSIRANSSAVLGDRTVLASVPGMAATTQAAIGLLTVTSASLSQPDLGMARKPHFRAGRAG